MKVKRRGFIGSMMAGTATLLGLKAKAAEEKKPVDRFSCMVPEHNDLLQPVYPPEASEEFKAGYDAGAVGEMCRFLAKYDAGTRWSYAYCPTSEDAVLAAARGATAYGLVSFTPDFDKQGNDTHVLTIRSTGKLRARLNQARHTSPVEEDTGWWKEPIES